MDRYKIFIREHREILETAENLDSLMKEQEYPGNCSSIVDLLAELSGKIKIHLAMEDKHLYPLLLKSNNPELKNLAEIFASEMGDIGIAFKGYIEKWGSQSSLTEMPDQFIEDSNELFTALKLRIEKEEDDLYPLAKAKLEK
jgi:hemerythrin-like domain-containing protein